MTKIRSKSSGRAHPLLLIMVLVFTMVLATGCGHTVPTAPKPAPRARHDPRTEHALLQIARQFNDDYAANRDAAVYDRWDAQSRAVIGRAAYIGRHRECPTAPGRATIQGSVHAGSWWLVHYSISGANLTDYWHYERGRWMFDLIRSNPQAVRLYRLPAAEYFKAVGCAGHS